MDQQVESGRYQSASEVVRAGLRLLERSDLPSTPALDAFRRQVAESGMTDGEVDALFERMIKETRATKRNGEEKEAI